MNSSQVVSTSHLSIDMFKKIVTDAPQKIKEAKRMLSEICIEQDSLLKSVMHSAKKGIQAKYAILEEVLSLQK